MTLARWLNADVPPLPLHWCWCAFKRRSFASNSRC